MTRVARQLGAIGTLRPPCRHCHAASHAPASSTSARSARRVCAVKTARWIPFKERRGTDGTNTSRSINLPQGESHRDNSMLVKRATPEDVYGAKRPQDLRDMVRALRHVQPKSRTTTSVL